MDGGTISVWNALTSCPAVEAFLMLKNTWDLRAVGRKGARKQRQEPVHTQSWTFETSYLLPLP